MQEAVLQRARFLIVDDEASNVRLLERMLEYGGAFQVKSTTESSLALALFLEWQPDIVLLDLHMPQVDGFELMRQFRASLEGGEYLPILVLSADITLETKRRALEGGAHDFLTKPFDHLEVLARIENLLENRFLHRALQQQNEELERQVQARTAQLEDTLNRLRAAQELVVKQERLRALGMMASGVAHDFNNALTVVMGCAELMAPYMRQHAPEQQLGHFENLMTAAEDAVHVVSRLREFYRPAGQDEVRVPLDVNAIVEQTLEMTASQWRNKGRALGIEIEAELALEAVPPLMGNASELREVLANLIFNAVDAMPKGGRLRVATMHREGRIQIQVEDTGVGMTEEERAHCLEPFFTTKGDSGTGLGLAVVFGFVQRYGGSIGVHSEPGKGTTMSLLLPAREMVTELPQEAKEGAVEVLRVLVVDDQELIRGLIAEMVAAEGHVVETAADARAALERLQAEKGQWDVLITDQSMPQMTGCQLAEQALARGCGVLTILLTGFGDEMRAQGGAPPGVDLIVGKPLTMVGLRHALQTVFEKRNLAQKEGDETPGGQEKQS